MAVDRKTVINHLRRIADKAEASGDRATAVKALRLAWDIACQGPANPKPPSIDTVIEIGQDAAALASRFNPEAVASIEAAVADLKACRLELAEAERENATLH